MSEEIKPTTWEKPLTEWSNEDLEYSLKSYRELLVSYKRIFPDQDDMGIGKILTEIENEILERNILRDQD